MRFFQLNFHVFIAAMFIFFCNIPKYAHALDNILSHSTDWPAWIAIMWNWTSLLNGLVGDNKNGLPGFNITKNLNAIYDFSWLYHYTGCLT